MSDVTKFLADDHARIRRAISEYWRTPSNLDAALNVCDTLWIHMTIEVEIQRSLGDGSTEAGYAMGVADDRLHTAMEGIEGLEPGDPSLPARMTVLSRALDGHVEAFQQNLVPRLAGRSDAQEMGSRAFQRWQELFESKTPRTWTPMRRLANTGWGGGGKLANSGW
ncbi:MAG TPA: hypothetical protein VHT75_10740 [Acidimicrobiales bacterium]|nr:hypothetical protein [Acidimicrobiales bacterium]